MKTFVFAVMLIIFTPLIPACKIDERGDYRTSDEDISFTGFRKIDDLLPTGHSLMGMDYQAPSKNLYFYMSDTRRQGHLIKQLDGN